MTFDITTDSPQQTIKFGQRFGSQLRGGEVVAICGELGSGKTHLIKGIAAGLGANETASEVNSPTFVIVNEYSGRLDIFHVDAYRLKSPAEFEAIGFDDYCRPDSVVLIEWADKVKSALERVGCIWIWLGHLAAGASHPQADEKRSIHIANLPAYIRI